MTAESAARDLRVAVIHAKPDDRMRMSSIANALERGEVKWSRSTEKTIRELLAAAQGDTFTQPHPNDLKPLQHRAKA